MPAQPDPIDRSQTGTPPQPPPAQPGYGSRRSDTIQPQYAFDPRSKSPVVASFLSMMPGLGQVYVGYYRLAFFNILIFAGTITLISVAHDPPVLPLAPIFLFFFWLYNIIDAGRRAALYNYAIQGGAGIDVPKSPEIGLPGPRGTLAAGLVLLAGGAILLSYTRFGFSLDWIEEWWPIAPIAFGVWLVVRGVTERQHRSPDAPRRNGSASADG